MRLTAVRCSDLGWSKAGYAVLDKKVSLENLDVLFVPGDGGLSEWGWEGLPQNVTSLCGVRCFPYARNESARGHLHPNGATSVDHVVLHSHNIDYVKAEFAKINLEPKRVRSDIYPGITQMFYRPGNGTIIEVVVSKDFEPHLWGMTVVVGDIDHAKAILGENSSKPKKAVQEGRRILTVRGQAIGIATNMAMMTPHPSKNSKL